MMFLLYCQAEGLGPVNTVSFETNDQVMLLHFTIRSLRLIHELYKISATHTL